MQQPVKGSHVDKRLTQDIAMFIG